MSEHDMNVHPLLRCSSWLKQHEIKFVVVGDIRNIPKSIDGDVDIVMSNENLCRLRKDIFRMADACSLRVLQCFQHEACAFYYVLKDTHSDSNRLLRLDICSDYLTNARRLIPSHELLSQVQTDTINKTPSGLPIPQDVAAFRYYLAKIIMKGNIDNDAYDYLRLLYQRIQHAHKDFFPTWLGKKYGSLVLLSFQKDNPARLRECIPELKKFLITRYPRRAKDIVSEFRRRVYRFLFPTGLVVAILGPDGSGKTVLLRELNDRLHPAFRKVRHLHFRPQFGKKTSEINMRMVTAPHNQKPRGLLLSVCKLLYYAMDYITGMTRLYFSCKVRSTLVLFDRYVQDIEIDRRRYRFGGPVWAAKVLGRIVPQPDLTIVLTGSPEIIWKRKQEMSLQDITNLCESYRRLASRENWPIIDATQPLQDVVNQAESHILDFLEQRLKCRLKISRS